MPSNAPAGSGDDMTQAAPEGVKYAEHVEVIIDNNRISVVNPMSGGSNATSTYWVMTMIYDKLVTYDEEAARFEPVLATHWETTDYKTFVFDLREDVYFHNGEHFTATDVVYTIDMARDAEGTMKSQWAPVETATALGDYKLELVLNGVNVDFLMNISQPVTGILNKKAIDADHENGIYIGTGAFIYTDFLSNEYVTLVRNDNYWGVMPITKSMTLHYIPEVATRALMILNNEAQVSFGTGVEDYDLFRNDDYSIFPLTMNNCQAISFNMINPITSDYNFRMAVAHAMDREEISIVCSGEWGAFLDDGAIWGFATEFRNSNVPTIPHDLALAKEYLAKSSYKGETIEITASIITNVKASEVLQSQLADIGINATVNATDSAGMLAKYFDTGHHIICNGIPFTYAAGSARQVFGPGGGNNRGSYENPEVTKLLTEAAATTDAAARSELYKEIQMLVNEDLPFINIFWRMNGIVGVKGLGGLKLPSDTLQTDLRGVFWIID